MEANREAQQQALRALDQLNIPYELIRHPAAGTIDEIAAMGIQKYGCLLYTSDAADEL